VVCCVKAVSFIVRFNSSASARQLLYISFFPSHLLAGERGGGGEMTITKIVFIESERGVKNISQLTDNITVHMAKLNIVQEKRRRCNSYTESYTYISWTSFQLISKVFCLFYQHIK